MYLANLSNQLLARIFVLKFFFHALYIDKKIMEIDNGPVQIIYPRNIKKYTGSIYGLRSRAKNGNKNIVSFRVCIKTENFKYYKCFPSREDAESDLIRVNHENRLEIKNTMQDCGDYYLVKLYGGKEFLTDKCDLHFIEAHVWYCSQNYVVAYQNGKKIKFHNLILNHTPIMNCSVDHINRNPFDNRRINLRLANQQTQTINQAPKKGAIQPGVHLDRNYWTATWVDEMGIKKNVAFSIKRFGYEAAKQLAITKRLEMELSLTHYRLALHNLPPLRPDEIEPEVREVPGVQNNFNDDYDESDLSDYDQSEFEISVLPGDTYDTASNESDYESDYESDETDDDDSDQSDDEFYQSDDEIDNSNCEIQPEVPDEKPDEM